LGKKTIAYIDAIREALREEMLRDPKVIVIGEDVGLGQGAFTVTKGLYQEFGKDRVIDTPISEESIIGACVGAAMAGLRPVAEIMFNPFMALVMDPLINHASCYKYVSGGQVKVPMVIRTLVCQGRGAGHDHAPFYASWFMHVPCIRVIVPSTPYDAKGLLKTAIRDDYPCIFYEHIDFYPRKPNLGEIPEEEYTIPLGKADIKKEGSDVTIVAILTGVKTSLSAAKKLEEDGINVEVVDPRTLAPLDKQTILDSVKKTGRLVIVETDFKTAGVGAEIAAIVAEEAMEYLDAPIKRVATADIPISFTNEKYILPNEEAIIKAVKDIC
jgi:pyruvate dehydrogenase E1 component beta subunit